MAWTAFVTAALTLITGQGVAWRDPSPHQVRFVTVDEGVRVEVLDWGGEGRPILFIGCYLTGHVYDGIAPKLTDRFHVYALTRRGIGASDHPQNGYDPVRRAADALDVIHAMHMEKPILVGNSCGGDILHALGAQHSEAVGGLLYLDAAEDPTLKLSDYPLVTVDQAHMPKSVRSGPKVGLPETETRQLAEHPLDPVIRKAIVEDNKVRPDYAHIRVPVVAVYRTKTLEQALQEFAPRNEEERAALLQAYVAGRGMLEKWESDLRAGVPDARIVELPGASLYMFLSNEADIIREVRTFAVTLGR
jgi:pimeloyl-ACP methyl ester carboxylesterase